MSVARLAAGAVMRTCVLPTPTEYPPGFGYAPSVAVNMTVIVIGIQSTLAARLRHLLVARLL